MPSIELHAAHRDDHDTLDSLMQFYLHDFSEWLPLKLGENGFYPIGPTLDYWRHPATRAFLIRVDNELAGFISVDGNTHLKGAEHNLGYLFVCRRWRGRGVAQFVVSDLLSRIPGQWQIFHIDANRPAQRFWAGAIPALSSGAFTCEQRVIDGYPCTVYGLQSPAPMA
ncbi:MULTISPECIES: GNAT family N-acetyltransferase [unclassified Pseudomonas]|uniref:GNAT family N-acetyltransferase n=1 Tax=unclassified Pseudomonas TaxID=196821 RepID=UPI000A1FA7DB|nr:MULTISPECIES: GNAT family N-acetyltransferase [unclassified Pseudomonas]